MEAIKQNLIPLQNWVQRPISTITITPLHLTITVVALAIFTIVARLFSSPKLNHKSFIDLTEKYTKILASLEPNLSIKYDKGIHTIAFENQKDAFTASDAFFSAFGIHVSPKLNTELRDPQWTLSIDNQMMILVKNSVSINS